MTETEEVDKRVAHIRQAIGVFKEAEFMGNVTSGFRISEMDGREFNGKVEEYVISDSFKAREEAYGKTLGEHEIKEMMLGLFQKTFNLKDRQHAEDFRNYLLSELDGIYEKLAKAEIQRGVITEDKDLPQAIKNTITAEITQRAKEEKIRKL